MNQTPEINILYQQDQLPVFQNRMYDNATEAINCPKGDIRLVEDSQTGLIYNIAFKPELMVYDENYQNEQAISPLFQNHLESVSLVISRLMGRESLVEVGCGKGFFLELLLKSGFDVTGFDPSYEGCNPKVRACYFKSEVGIKASGIILRHVLEHIPDPFNFLLEIKKANGGVGKVYIEVPCFDWICDNNAWFDIFYEHVNYFRISDFCGMFDEIHEIGHLFGGQYIYVVAELAAICKPKFSFDNRIKLPENFGKKFFLNNLKKKNEIAIWGGASKGVVFSLLSMRSGHAVGVVIDINPAKQGKYLPATGLLVQSPSLALPQLPLGSVIYIMNSIYADEIKSMSGNFYEYIEIDHGFF